MEYVGQTCKNICQVWDSVVQYIGNMLGIGAKYASNTR